MSRFVSRIRSGHYKPTEARKNIDKSIDKSIDNASIIEEKSLDIPDDKIKPTKSTLIRQQPVTKKSPRVQKKLSENGSASMNAQESVCHSPETVKREIPGRRKPAQPEPSRQWHDSKCNSIDEDDDRFYTAIES